MFNWGVYLGAEEWKVYRLGWEILGEEGWRGRLPVVPRGRHVRAIKRKFYASFLLEGGTFKASPYLYGFARLSASIQIIRRDGYRSRWRLHVPCVMEVMRLLMVGMIPLEAVSSDVDAIRGVDMA